MTEQREDTGNGAESVPGKVESATGVRVTGSEPLNTAALAAVHSTPHSASPEEAPPHARHARGRVLRDPLVLLFTAAILLNALLLFMVQPMFGKMVLPRVGGTPAVWNTCLLFFQGSLLAGYLYAHLVARRLAPRAVVMVD